MQTSKLSSTFSADVQNLLLPYLQTEAERRRILEAALGEDSPDLREISFVGSSEGFVQSLILTLAHKEAYPGRNALVAVLSQIRLQVDSDTYIDLKNLQDRLSQELENYQLFSEANLVFVSHASQDNEIATRIAKDLSKLGIKVWIDDERLQGGHHWRSEIFRGLRNAESVVVLLTPASVIRPWVQREVSSAILLKKKIFPLHLENSFDLIQANEIMRQLQDVQFIDFRQHQDLSSYDDAIRVLHAALMRRDKNQSPFRGLHSFEATDAEIFFGRENEATEIRRQIQENKAYRLSVITGLSGTGKSSIMKAGVMAAMIPSSPIYDPYFQGWKYSLVRFANKPFLALAQALNEELLSVSTDKIEAELAIHPQSFFKYSNEILASAPPNTQYVLFIDQFEELFRYEAVINPILDLIFEAVTKPEYRIYVVLTIRSDFFLRLSEHLGINQVLNEAGHLRIISHMSRENILRTIIEPAQVVDLVYETGLANQILDDATAQAGSLPLLQYSLQQLYEQRQDRMLTKAAYSKLGGIHQALARHAESVYESLSPSQQRLMRRLMLELVTINEEQLASRMRRQLDELQFAEWSEDEVRYLVDYLLSANARLLTMSRQVTNNEEELNKQYLNIELAHEALLSEWSHLRNWIAENRVLLVQRDRYERLAREWRAKNRSAADLLREANLLEAVRWLSNPDTTSYISTDVENFIQSSLNYDARLWHESGRDVDLLISSQLEFLQIIQKELPADSPYFGQATQEFIAECTLAEANPYHRNAILWTRDEDVSALNIPLEPAQTWIENPEHSLLIGDIHRRFFRDAFSLRAADWDKNQRSSEFLLKRHEIDRMQHLLNNAKQDWYLSDILRDYISKSQREYQRRQRLQFLVSVVVTILALAASLLAYVANQRAETELLARQEAEIQRNLAQSRQYAVQSQLALQDGDLQAAMMLGIEAYDTAETSDALSSLLTALQLSPQLDHYLFSIDSGIHAMTARPDAEEILLGTENGDILRYQPESQSLELLHEDTHEGSVWNLLYLEDGNRFLSVGTDGWLRLWNLSTGEMEQEVLRDELGGSYALARHPSQDLIAMGGDDGNIYLWNAESAEIDTIPYHQNTIYSMEFSPDGSVLAVASADNSISLWQVSDLSSPYLVLAGHNNWILDIAFHPTSNVLASAGADNLIKVWDLVSGLEISSLDDHSNWVRQVSFTQDGQTLISASQDRQIFLWNVDNPENPVRSTAPLIAHLDTVHAILLSDANRFISAGEDGQVIEWQSQAQLPLGQTVLGAEGMAYDSIFNSDSNLLISTVNNLLFFTDIETLDPTREAISVEGIVTALDYLPNSTSFVFATDSGELQVWDIVLARSNQSFHEHNQAVYELAVSSDGQWLASASEDKTVVLRNLENNTSQVLDGHTDRVNALAFSPDGQWLASAGHDQDIRIWNTTTGTENRLISQAHSRPIEALAFSFDGNELMSAARDNIIALWNPQTGEQTALLAGHAGAVNSLSVYGSFLVSGSSDGNVILWDILDRYLIGRYSLANADDVLSVRFSPDGQQISAAYANGEIVLWDSSVVSWQDIACNRLGNSTFNSIRQSLDIEGHMQFCN